MAVNFKVPASPQKSIVTISDFLGVDFTNSPANVDEQKSPNSENMIRDVPGKVRKRMGYQTVKKYDGKINGAHMLRGSGEPLIHAGTKLYKGDVVLYSDANDTRSRSWQFDKKLYIIDGKALLVYDGETVKKVSEGAYIPTLTISKEPTGGGKDYEALNLLQPAFTELFYSNGTAKAYHLTFGELDETPVKVEILDEKGDWQEKKRGRTSLWTGKVESSILRLLRGSLHWKVRIMLKSRHIGR